MSRLYIVRHGNTFDKGDVVLRVGRKTDLPLSSSGIEQAKALNAHLADVKFDLAYSSDLKRTRQTIEIVMGHGNFIFSDALTEIDYGPDEGKPESDVVKRLGQAAIDLWNEKSIPPEGWLVEAEQIRADWVQFLARLPRNKNIIVLTSNGTARFLLDIVKNGQSAERKLRTGSYGVVNLSDTGPELESWNIRP